MTTVPVYAFEDVGFTFSAHGKQVAVLSELDIDIMPGERIILRGPSGVGKTTILNIMAGFLSPTLGRIRFNGRDLRSLSNGEMADFRNSQIGIVHQFFNLIPAFSSLANAAVPLLSSGCARREAMGQAMELLDRVGVAGRAEHYPREMSGGEQQRVAIARAVIRRPSVILADEPTGNLDGATGAAILELLDELAGDHMTMIVATHDDAVTRFGDRVIDLGPAEPALILEAVGADTMTRRRS